MQESPQEIRQKQQEQIDKINKHFQQRAQKFGSEFTPITLEDYKLYKIQKASQTGKMQYLQGILLSDIADLQQRKKKIKQRTQKFFPNIKVETNTQSIYFGHIEFFNKRQDPDFTQDNTQIRYNAYYLFGVDYMSNEKIRNYFHTNPHFKIEWLNDSSCNICFNTKQQAQQAIKPYIKGNQMKNSQQQIWYQLQQYQVDGVQRKLFCRLATNKDVKPQTVSGHDSKYYKWETNKKKINNYVKGRAYQYINKQKKIKKQNAVKNPLKKQNQQQHSSSGVNDSDQQKNKKNEENVIKQEINKEIKKEVNKDQNQNQMKQ